MIAATVRAEFGALETRMDSKMQALEVSMLTQMSQSPCDVVRCDIETPCRR